jgi:DNA-binding CsgD family transcriptional regulator
MERLRQRDLGALLNFLHLLYDFRDLDAFQADVCSALSGLVPVDITSYNEINRRQGRSRNVVEPPGLNTPERRAIWDRHLHEHPVVAHYQRTNDPRCLKISDFLSRRRFHRLGLYNEHYRALRMEYQIGSNLASTRLLVVGFSLSRAALDFSERERAMLDLARPHLVQAYQNSEAVATLQRTLALTEEMRGGGRAAVVPLTPTGRPQTTSPGARQLLSRYFDGRWPQSGALPDDLARWVRSETSRLGQTDSPPPVRTPLVVNGDGAQLIVRLFSATGSDALLLEERATAMRPERLAPLGLTRREDEVLTWVAEGKTNKQIAATLGTSSRTIQKHLEHIFAKLAVETRTAAAACAGPLLLQSNPE